MTAPLLNLLITVNLVPLEKLYFRDTEIPKTVNTLTVDDKHYVLNRDNLTQPIQIQLSQKQKNFSQFFLHF